MYAVVKTGGKQTRVAQGERVQVEHLGVAVGDDVALTPVLVVDGDDVLATATQLSGASVTARVVGETKGPKIDGFKYRDKTNWRRRFGHRQHYTEVEIVTISRG